MMSHIEKLLEKGAEIPLRLEMEDSVRVGKGFVMGEVP